MVNNRQLPQYQPVTIRSVTAAVSAVVLVGGVVAFWYNEQVGIRHVVEMNDREIRAHLQIKVDELRTLTLNQATDTRNSSRQQYNELLSIFSTSIKDLRDRMSDHSERLSSLEATVSQALLHATRYDSRIVERIERLERQYILVWQNHPTER